MKLKRSGDGEGLPFMLRAPEGEIVTFEVKMDSIEAEDSKGKDLKNDKGWSIYLAKFRNIKCEDKPKWEAEDGEDEVPFYMMNDFADWAEDQPDKGWVECEFTRSKSRNGKNTGEFA